MRQAVGGARGRRGDRARSRTHFDGGRRRTRPGRTGSRRRATTSSCRPETGPRWSCSTAPTAGCPSRSAASRTATTTRPVRAATLGRLRGRGHARSPRGRRLRRGHRRPAPPTSTCTPGSPTTRSSAPARPAPSPPRRRIQLDDLYAGARPGDRPAGAALRAAGPRGRPGLPRLPRAAGAARDPAHPAAALADVDGPRSTCGAGCPRPRRDDGVTRRPRVRLGDLVLSRRSWTRGRRVAARRVQQPGDGRRALVPAAGSAGARARPARPGVRHRRRQRRRGGAAGAKPQYVDFGSPLSLTAFEALLKQRAGDRVVFREMLPAEDELHVRSAAARHVAELAVETFTHRRPTPTSGRARTASRRRRTRMTTTPTRPGRRRRRRRPGRVAGAAHLLRRQPAAAAGPLRPPAGRRAHRRTGCSPGYFFINYWLEGPHVRLRLRAVRRRGRPRGAPPRRGGGRRRSCADARRSTRSTPASSTSSTTRSSSIEFPEGDRSAFIGAGRPDERCGRTTPSPRSPTSRSTASTAARPGSSSPSGTSGTPATWSSTPSAP